MNVCANTAASSTTCRACGWSTSSRNARQLGDVGERFIRRTQPGLEAQLANLADAIAYNNHDVDDGERAGLIAVEDLREVRVFEKLHTEVVRKYTNAPPRRQLYETIRRMIDYLVSDLIEQTYRNIRGSGVDTIDAVRAHPKPLVSLSDGVLEEHQELKRFLRSKLYNHSKVREVMDEARTTLKFLFEAYMNDPKRLPSEHQILVARAEAEGGKAARARVVADYVAGMTDRFAITEKVRAQHNGVSR
jgi:dGTPase